MFGISYDDAESHKKFKEKFNLPFTLLSDVDKKVSKAYGADGMLFANRKTFLINKEGIIFKTYQKVDVSNHSEEILADFASQIDPEEPRKK